MTRSLVQGSQADELLVGGAAVSDNLWVQHRPPMSRFHRRVWVGWAGCWFIGLAVAAAVTDREWLFFPMALLAPSQAAIALYGDSQRRRAFRD